MPDSLVIYGTIAVDTLITPHGRADATVGGSGIYAALAARLTCPRHALLGVMGSDFPPTRREQLEKAGVNFRYVVTLPGKTFSWTGRYEEDMNYRTSLRTDEGVQAQWTPVMPPHLRRSCRVLALANVSPPLQYAMLEQCNPGAFTLADFMKSQIIREPEYTKRLLSRTDMALMNDEEARQFAQTDDLTEAGLTLLRAGPSDAIVKHGSAGSTLYHREEDGTIRTFRCPPTPVVAVDPTGAGDSYLGALAGYICQASPDQKPSWEMLCRAVSTAGAIAAHTCEQVGVESLLTLR